MTGLVRGWGRVFHMEENRGRLEKGLEGLCVPNLGPV
jgi:hypothetical protein